MYTNDEKVVEKPKKNRIPMNIIHEILIEVVK
jgi:hypothetical protein